MTKSPTLCWVKSVITSLHDDGISTGCALLITQLNPLTIEKVHGMILLRIKSDSCNVSTTDSLSTINTEASASHGYRFESDLSGYLLARRRKNGSEQCLSRSRSPTSVS